MSKVAAVILAAGEGTRMKSSRPKVLHPVGGRAMILWSVRNARATGAGEIVLVVGEGAEAIREAVGDEVRYVCQAEQLGTGHATLQAREALAGKADIVFVLYGDMPTLRAETLRRVIRRHEERRPAVTILSVTSGDSMGFGRVVRDEAGNVREIVEEAVAEPEILAIKELNCGVYCFDAPWLWKRLPDVSLTQPKGEYYLTDMVGLAVQDGRAVEAVTISDVEEVQGINTRVHLARAEGVLRERINRELMLSGVTIIDPATTYIEADVQVGRDTVIHPNTHLQGKTVIGEECVIGPDTIVQDTHVGDRCEVVASVLEEAILEDDVDIGPFGHLRPGAHLGQGVHMGNFGEVKNSYLAPGTKMGHFSYLGDAEVGRDVNVGAGTITCNYDGRRKHPTVIEEGAFIGSGTMLVAPVRVGKGAKIGAGAVVTRDVPAGTLAYGVPARHKGPAKSQEAEDGDGD
ncbi:MAG: bifunctional UDP-N-acetylglucosamine diphosphorylase/glucosamine-1-phosphate N-acetyltransferase GlmU [Chloroflexota bacterium]|nr:bifunctional UDP-N-acetylglucosamine diphosphorylase/glucosamine-1-phosphate N-acetyltransferase GlmU [Chloroflexota bacterium]